MTTSICKKRRKIWISNHFFLFYLQRSSGVSSYGCYRIRWWSWSNKDNIWLRWQFSIQRFCFNCRFVAYLEMLEINWDIFAGHCVNNRNRQPKLIRLGKVCEKFWFHANFIAIYVTNIWRYRLMMKMQVTLTCLKI